MLVDAKEKVTVDFGVDVLMKFKSGLPSVTIPNKEATSYLFILLIRLFCKIPRHQTAD